jgi:mannosyltransferase OCH1-like enzyme
MKEKILYAILASALLFIIYACFYNTYSVPHHIGREDKMAPKEINGVPLVIYQSWQSHIVPKGMKENILKTVENNPEFDYYLFSDADSRAFISANYDARVVKAFDSLRPGAYKSDLWRYCILYKQGGIYFDIKMVPLVPLKNILESHSTVFVKDIKNPERLSECVWNGLMISPPKNEIFQHCIDEIVESCEKQLYRRNNLDITGPCLLGRKIKEHALTDFFNNNVLNLSGDYINYHSIPFFLREYPGYRREQSMFQNNKHYTALYSSKQVYY